MSLANKFHITLQLTMDPVHNFIMEMNGIILEDENEEDGGPSIEISEGTKKNNHIVFNAKLCLIGRFITEWQKDVSTIKQTLTTIWRPDKDIFIRNKHEFLYVPVLP